MAIEDPNLRPMVLLDSCYTQVPMAREERERAVQDAHWVTLSPHEHVWTTEQQVRMARYVLWAAQRLAVLRNVASGIPLLHRPEGG